MSVAAQQKFDVRPLNEAAYSDFTASMRAAYPEWSGSFWRRETIAHFMVLITDGALSLLRGTHQYGSVQNLKDRRADLYPVRVKHNKPHPLNSTPP